VSFIESNVIPKLRTAFESMAYSLARKTERDGKNNVETRIISVENVLREIRQLSSALDAYIDHREGKPSTIEEPCQEQPSGAALLCQVLEQGKKAQLSALCQTLEKARQNQMGSQYRYFKEHLN
ncbi:MAG: hypothetical protein K2K53_03435, partial [Oscillospiraceae bacterium]|nr:hypothetical protein [Oscillospiraceae bacterium]